MKSPLTDVQRVFRSLLISDVISPLTVSVPFKSIFTYLLYLSHLCFKLQFLHYPREKCCFRVKKEVVYGSTTSL